VGPYPLTGCVDTDKLTKISTDTARHVLNVALLRHEQGTGQRLPLDGWEHYYTATDERGVSVFSFDRAPEDTAGWLRIEIDGDHGPLLDLEQSGGPIFEGRGAALA
jgi:hypothetical protein